MKPWFGFIAAVNGMRTDPGLQQVVQAPIPLHAVREGAGPAVALDRVRVEQAEVEARSRVRLREQIAGRHRQESDGWNEAEVLHWVRESLGSREADKVSRRPR